MSSSSPLRGRNPLEEHGNGGTRVPRYGHGVPVRFMFPMGILLLLGTISSRTTAATFTQGRAQPPFSALGTGDYVWEPEVSPTGPVVIIVSVPEQRIYVYRNGVRIGRSTASTGKPDHRTPTGVFTILEKEVYHRSNLYHGAPMP